MQCNKNLPRFKVRISINNLTDLFFRQYHLQPLAEFNTIRVSRVKIFVPLHYTGEKIYRSTGREIPEKVKKLEIPCERYRIKQPRKKGTKWGKYMHPLNFCTLCYCK